MKKKEILLTAIDIGSSKVCCLMSGMPDQKGVLDISGYGTCSHRCLSNGVVTDIKGLSEAISAAVCEAEEVSGQKAQSAFFNISGTHLKSIISHGEVVISDRDNEITRHDIDRVISNAKAIHMPYERDIIYSVREDFVVDSETGIKNPVGMFGIKLEVNLFLVTAKIAIIDNLKKAIRYSGLGIEESIVSSLAGSSGCITSHEKDLGVVFVDIGAAMTDIMIFVHSRPVFLKTLPLGGDIITKRLAEKLFISEQAAEKLKLEKGSVEPVSRPEKINLATESGKKTISNKVFRNILQNEYTSIFNAIKKEIECSGFSDSIPSGVVVCGQAITMDGCIECAEGIFDYPVRMGHIIGLGMVPKPLPSSIYATAVGLLKMGVESRWSRVNFFKLGPKNWAIAFSEYIKRLYNDYF
jgi:cell division protein FtsA